MRPLRRIRLWRGRRTWLRDPERALKLLEHDPGRLDAESQSILSWLYLTYARDADRAERGDRERARKLFAELVALEPDYLVYASDYVTLGTLQLETGDREAARATWRAGAGVYPRNADLRRLLEEHFGETPPEKAPKIPPVQEDELGVRRIPVRTRMITSRTGVLDLVD